MKTKSVIDISYTAITKLGFVPPWVSEKINWEQFGVEVYLPKKRESIERDKEIFIHVKLLRRDGKIYVMPLEYVKEFVKDFGFQGAKRVTTYMCISKTNQLDNPQNYIRGLIK
tara:strand:- start:1278 stop:1616 length:339 start_codon:yes stop_codon:yes gene_type:complete